MIRKKKIELYKIYILKLFVIVNNYEIAKLLVVFPVNLESFIIRYHLCINCSMYNPWLWDTHNFCCSNRSKQGFYID